MATEHTVILTEEQIETIDYAISQLENNLKKDYPNDADIRIILKNIKTISKNINESLKRELYLSI